MMVSTEYALEIRHLAKAYGSSMGISDVSIQVKRGSLHGFLGPNGAGKTTTLKCVMGLLWKSSGEIDLFGKASTSFDAVELKRRVGYSPELPYYPGYLLGREVLMAYARMRGLNSGKEPKELLQRVGLGDAADKRVSKYSRGMQSRLGVAVALLGDPELLLLDEPIAGMDPLGVVEMRKMFRRLASEGRTILLSSHQLNEVQQTCSAVTVVNHGKTVAEGPVEELTKRLQGGFRFVAEFSSLSEPLLQAISRIPGVVEVRRVPDKPRSVLVKVNEDIDVREQLARAGVECGSLMLSCEKEGASLEALFLSLVGRGEGADTQDSTQA